ncbi:CARDB domain-containing protein [Pantanalinema sp. GBBB05]|uniref:CARDB domain-containing protein n=1 Tax=Pantanalinema sp. GBBB05 TaxID=2604139 RepID=UPI001D254881|nr:hypothetical protein [Pantanalinema sp. GBBB05]
MPTDNAGNTLGTARDISLISAMSFTDRVDALDPNDYYRFTLTSRSSVNFTLANLSANAELQLLDSSSTVLQSSQNSNAMTDLIIATLDPGTYYVRVFPGSGSAGTDYSLSTSAYTGSRQLELFWRDSSSGANGLWHMGGINNTTIASISPVNAVATNWQIDAIADFNQDGTPDFVWRDYATGNNSIWFMGGSTNDTLQSIASLAAMSTNWRLEGVADFNGDNRPDLVWRDYTQGYNQIWFMGGTNNTAIASTAALTQVGTSWSIDAVADINGDARPDLVWREYTQGATGVWFMGGTNNTTIASTAALNSVPINWHLEGVADFNQDNRPDLVWRDYSSGSNGVWLMGGTNNTAIVSSVALSPVAANWRMTPFTRFNQPAVIDGAGNSTAAALNIGSLSGNAIFRETVHRSDGDDYYRFSIDATSNFNLTLNEQNAVNADANVQLWDAFGNVIQHSFSGTSTEFISRTLNPGTYYIRVYQSASETTNYTLNLSSTASIASPDLRGSFFDVTPEPLNAGSSFTTNFRIQNAGSSSAGAFRVGFHLSSDSTITTSDRLLSFYDIAALAAGTTTGALSTSLTLPGATDSFWSGSNTYYIGMIVDSLNAISESNESNNANLGNSTDWDDVFVQLPFITVTAPNGGNSLAPGSSYIISWNDNISENVRIDLYRGTTYVNTIATSVLSSGSYNWVVPATGLTFANDYRIRISSVNNSNLFDDSNTAFTIVPIDNALNTLDVARPITLSSITTTFSDWVGALDTNDYYRFTLSTLSNFNLTLNGLSSDADVALLNASGVAIASSTAGSNAAELITQQLVAGTYYIRVYPYSGETTYNLNVAATGVPASIDLQGTFFDVTPEPLTAGNSYTANFRLQNMGSGNAGAFRVGFYLSTDSTITTSDRQLGFYDITALAANTVTSTLSTTLALPGMTDSFWSGSRTYYIGMIVDSLNGISESNESNNANLGNGTDWDDVAITVPSIVTLTASDPNAAEVASGQPANPGQFTFSRTGDTSTALTVYYTIGGSATNGSDYNSISNSITFQAGQSTAILPITIINDLLTEGNETVVLTLNSSSSYTLGSSTTGTVAIADYVSSSSPFNIQFDYRFDTNGWFTSGRRAALEVAASIWESIILDEFANIPVGTALRVRNPQTDTIVSLTSDFEIDDLVVFVGARSIDGSSGTLADGGSSATWIVGSSLDTRYNGSDFEPWTGSISFDTAENWFFDSTPNTANDIPLSSPDFISVAVHELGHILGFGNVNAFMNFRVNDTFTGANARAVNGGNPIPLQPGGFHILDGYEFNGSGETALDPITMSGRRKLPTILDIAILDDIGYTVNYSAVSQNPSS